VNHNKLLTEQELAAIRQRERNATAGPWQVHEHEVDAFLLERGISTAWKDPKLEWTKPIVHLSTSEAGAGVSMTAEDADFIAHARLDVEKLMATLDVFGHHVIYDALMYYYRRGLFRKTDSPIIEQALESCWRIIKSRSDDNH
jgi:hypothetical protein